MDELHAEGEVQVLKIMLFGPFEGGDFFEEWESI